MLGPNIMGMLFGGAAIAAFAGFAGWSARGEIQNSKLGQNFVEKIGTERSTSIKREVNLWSVIGDERRTRRDTIDAFMRINEVSAEARAKMAEAMKRERAAADAAMNDAISNMRKLADADNELIVDWREKVIPPDITCGVFNGAGCPAAPDPTRGADSTAGVEVRDGRPAAAADPAP